MGTLVLLFAEVRGWALAALAAKGAGAAFVVATAICVIVFVLQHRQRVVASLPRAERRAQETRTRTRWIVRGRGSSERKLSQTLSTDALTPALPRASECFAISRGERERDPEIEELYRFVTTVWPTGKVGREHCRDLGFMRSAWERMVGGRRGEEGLRFAPRAGAGCWTGRVWCGGRVRGGSCAGSPLRSEEALSWNEELRQYADERARTVRIA